MQQMYTKSHKGQAYNWLNGVLTFDIETVPNLEMVERVPPEFEAPSNYKDLEKIAAYVEEKQAAFLDRTPLDIDYAKVHSVGMALGNGPIVTLIVGQESPFGKDGQVLLKSMTEVDILRAFWTHAAKAGKLAGYNIIGFDLPILQRRSWVLGIENVRPLFNLKPWDPLLLDVMRAFYHNGYGPGPKYRGLKDVAKFYHIDNPLPDLDGSQYSDMDPETQRLYLENDVRMTRELVKRTHGHYWS